MRAAVGTSGHVANGHSMHGTTARGVIVPPASLPSGKPTSNFYQLFLAVDAGHIYWKTREDPGFFKGQQGRAHIDGSGIDPLTILNAKGEPINIHQFALTFAIDGSHIYLPQEGFSTSHIARANLDGSEYQSTWLTYASAEAIAMSVFGEYLYFIPSILSVNKPIARVKNDGTELDLGFFVGTAGIRGMDVKGRYAYVTCDGFTRGVEVIDFLEETRTLVIPATGTQHTQGAIVADATHVYWLVRDTSPAPFGTDAIGRAKLVYEGGVLVGLEEIDWSWTIELTPRGIPGSAVLNGLAVDSNYVYWIEGAEGFSFIARRSLATGAIEREWLSGAAKAGGHITKPGAVAAGRAASGVVSG